MNSYEYSQIVEDIERLVVSSFLPQEAQTQYQSGAIAQKHLIPFAERLKILSDQYVQKPEHAPTVSMQDAQAYALYYLLINAAKIAALTTNLSTALLNRPLKILDYGSGPGTASLAYLFSNPLSHSIDLVDTQGAMRTCADILLTRWERLNQKNISWKTHSTLPSDVSQYDIIFVANMFSESKVESNQGIIKSLIGKLSESGQLVVVEPGTVHATRKLMSLRDRLVEQKEMKVVFPCTHQLSCPLLKLPDQWCHGTLHWTMPKLVKQFDQILGFNKHRIKYSAAIFQKEDPNVSGYRLLQDPEKSKKGVSFMLCGKGALHQITLPKGKAGILQRLETWDIVAEKDLPNE